MSRKQPFGHRVCIEIFDYVKKESSSSSKIKSLLGVPIVRSMSLKSTRSMTSDEGRGLLPGKRKKVWTIFKNDLKRTQEYLSNKITGKSLADHIIEINTGNRQLEPIHHLLLILTEKKRGWIGPKAAKEVLEYLIVNSAAMKPIRENYVDFEKYFKEIETMKNPYIRFDIF